MGRLFLAGVVTCMLVTMVHTSWAGEPARKSKGASIQGNALILEEGFTFKRTEKGVQLVDPTGRYAVTYICTGCDRCGVSVTPHALLCGGKCEGGCSWEETR